MYKQGDIVLIPIPFTDLTSSKKRPVLVISNDVYNRNTDDFVVAAVTSNVDNKVYIIDLGNNDLSEGALTKKSCIRADKIYTLSQSIAIKKFGHVKSEVLNKTRQKIEEIINSRD